MSRKVRRKQHQAVRLLDQAIKRFKSVIESSSSYKPNTDTSVATFERYVKRLEILADDPESVQQFWTLYQKVSIRLLKQTLKLRD